MTTVWQMQGEKLSYVLFHSLCTIMSWTMEWYLRLFTEKGTVLACQSCCNKVPHTRWIQPQTCTDSSGANGLGIAGSFWGCEGRPCVRSPSLSYRWAPSPGSSRALPSLNMCLCPNLHSVKPSAMWDCMAHSNDLILIQPPLQNLSLQMRLHYDELEVRTSIFKFLLGWGKSLFSP